MSFSAAACEKAAQARPKFPSLLSDDDLGAFAFAGMENNGLMRGGLIGRGATAMRVAMEVELASPELAPQQTRRSERHDDEGDNGLPVPVHAANIVGWSVVATGKSCGQLGGRGS